MPGLYAIANPIPAAPAKHGMIASASSDNTPDRWDLGYTICPENCIEVSTWDPDCEAWTDGNPPIKSESSDNLTCYDVDPFVIESAFECSTVGFSTQDYPGRARRQLEAATSKALEFETWTGTLKPDNPNLVTGAIVLNSGGATDPVTVLAQLGQALSNCAHGGKGTIHAPTTIVDLWMGMPGTLVKEVGQRLETANRGDVVISGTGYPGTGPDGVEPAGGTMWAFATGPVQYRVGDIAVFPDNIREATDHRHNRIEYRAERFGATNFDPCCHFGILVSVDGTP